MENAHETTLPALALLILTASAFSAGTPGARFIENFDENGDGQITFEEIRGEGMSREITDLNGDGQVTLEEFQAATDAWFAKKDRNGDGVITTADFGPRGN